MVVVFFLAVFSVVLAMPVSLYCATPLGCGGNIANDLRGRVRHIDLLVQGLVAHVGGTSLLACIQNCILLVYVRRTRFLDCGCILVCGLFSCVGRACLLAFNLLAQICSSSFLLNLLCVVLACCCRLCMLHLL